MKKILISLINVPFTLKSDYLNYTLNEVKV